MATAADNIPGVSILADDLIDLRSRLSGISAARIKRRASFHSGAREVQLRRRGMEYEETRAYVYGDDIRTMDWRVMARTGEAHTKIFVEEKERCCLIAVDLSASMFFGTRFSFKSWAAAQVAAHTGWLANFAGERIGGLVVSPGYHREIRPGKTRSGLLGLFHHLARAGKRDSSRDLSDNRFNFLLSELNRVAKPNSNITLISDFIGLDDQALRSLSNITRHNQVGCYWVHDDSEVMDWHEGVYPVLTGQGTIDFDMASTATRSWLRQCQLDNRRRIESLTSGLNIPVLPISCNRDISTQFLQGLDF